MIAEIAARLAAMRVAAQTEPAAPGGFWDFSGITALSLTPSALLGLVVFMILMGKLGTPREMARMDKIITTQAETIQTQATTISTYEVGTKVATQVLVALEKAALTRSDNDDRNST